jgi:nucleoside-diphosphate-sugar epimerase
LSDLALVTGASGFIGHHLVHTLVERGERVRCLVRASSDISHLPIEQIELCYGDALDPESLVHAVAGTVAVYHVAGSIDATDRQTLYKVNVDGSRNIAAACASQPDPPVLILVSSQEAGGPELDGRPRHEKDPSEPVTHYGKSKLMGEHAASEFAGQVPLTIVRASAVFGEYDRETLNVFKAFQLGGAGLYPLPGANHLRLSLIYARELAGFLMLAADRGERFIPEGPPGNGMYYAAYDVRPTFAELIKMAACALNYERVHIIEVPIGAVWLAGGLSELWARISGRPAGILNLDKARAAAAGSWTCSPGKSMILGFSPEKELAERVQQTAHWYRENGWL